MKLMTVKCAAGGRALEERRCPHCRGLVAFGLPPRGVRPMYRLGEIARIPTHPELEQAPFFFSCDTCDRWYSALPGQEIVERTNPQTMTIRLATGIIVTSAILLVILLW